MFRLGKRLRVWNAPYSLLSRSVTRVSSHTSRQEINRQVHTQDVFSHILFSFAPHLDLVLLTSVLDGLKDSPGATAAHFQPSNVAPIPPLDQDGCLESWRRKPEAACWAAAADITCRGCWLLSTSVSNSLLGPKDLNMFFSVKRLSLAFLTTFITFMSILQSRYLGFRKPEIWLRPHKESSENKTPGPLLDLKNMGLVYLPLSQINTSAFAVLEELQRGSILA